MNEITIRSESREEMIDITGEVARRLAEGVIATAEPPRPPKAASTPPLKGGELLKRLSSGVVILFVQHTTCGLTVNENADPHVQSDMLGMLRDLIPQYYKDFKHAEENSDAHIKASLVGSSVTVPFEDGKLLLGRWQGIYLCEFDGPRERKVVLQIIT